MSSESSGAATAVGVIAVMGIFYWLAYLAAVIVLFAAVAGLVAIGAAVGFTIWFLFYAEKPGLKGWLIFVSGAVPLVTSPFFVMYFIVLGQRTSVASDELGLAKNLLSIFCFFWLVLDLWLVAPLYLACLDY